MRRRNHNTSNFNGLFWLVMFLGAAILLLHKPEQLRNSLRTITGTSSKPVQASPVIGNLPQEPSE